MSDSSTPCVDRAVDFIPPADHVERTLERACQRNWPVVQQLEALHGKVADSDIVSTVEAAFTLRVWLGDLPYTMGEHWAWNEAVPGRVHKMPYMEFGPAFMRFAPVISDSGLYGPEPFVQPVLVNLNDHRGENPKGLRESDSVGLELFALFAADRDCLPAFDEAYELPRIYLSALQTNLTGGWRGHAEPADWRGMPALYWDRPSQVMNLTSMRMFDGVGGELATTPTVRVLEL